MLLLEQKTEANEFDPVRSKVLPPRTLLGTTLDQFHEERPQYSIGSTAKDIGAFHDVTPERLPGLLSDVDFRLFNPNHAELRETRTKIEDVDRGVDRFFNNYLYRIDDRDTVRRDHHQWAAKSTRSTPCMKFEDSESVSKKAMLFERTINPLPVCTNSENLKEKAQVRAEKWRRIHGSDLGLPNVNPSPAVLSVLSKSPKTLAFRRSSGQPIHNWTIPIQDTPTEANVSGVVVPLNVAHTFGTQRTQALLSDIDKVNITCKQIVADRWPQSRQRWLQKTRSPVNKPKQTNYTHIGTLMRSNIMPGDTRTQQHGAGGIEKDIYTWTVFDKHKPLSDQYRHKKDEYTTWREMNVLYQNRQAEFDKLLDENRMSKEANT